MAVEGGKIYHPCSCIQLMRAWLVLASHVIDVYDRGLGMFDYGQ